MGIFYSHIVFQPPSPPSYDDRDATLTFRKARPTTPNPTKPASPRKHTYVAHPLLYLTTSAGNTIPAAYFPHQNSHYTILFSHGNGEDLGVTASYALQLSTFLRTSVFCYDYSGYGLSTGKPSEANAYADIRAAYHHLVSELRIPPDRILLFGRSLGSGPSVDLAASLGRNLGGLVLISPITSCVRVVFPTMPHTPGFDMFANLDKIEKVQAPVFCVHGMADDVVPFSHGVQLASKARYPLQPLWLPEAGHNNLESSRFQYEVFLRYMKVLQEFRRWAPPEEPLDPPTPRSAPQSPTSLLRKSSGALGKFTSCFGRRQEKAAARAAAGRMRGKKRDNNNSSGSNHSKSPTSSYGQLFFARKRTSAGHAAELNRKILAAAAAVDRLDGRHSVLTRRSSDATFGSRSAFDDRDGDSLDRSLSVHSMASAGYASTVAAGAAV